MIGKVIELKAVERPGVEAVVEVQPELVAVVVQEEVGAVEIALVVHETCMKAYE